MNILITGANGFIGRNLSKALRDDSFLANHSLPVMNLLEYDVDTPPEMLIRYCQQADFVFNLAGIMRPKDPADFMLHNYQFAATVIRNLVESHNTCPAMYASSIQAVLDTEYAASKRAGEQLFRDYELVTGARAVVYRFTNLFGPLKRPNADSVVATFCYNVGRGLPIKVNDPNVMMTFAYIDDCIHELALCLRGEEHYKDGFATIPITHQITVGKLAEVIKSFEKGYISKEDIIEDNVLLHELFFTYQSYLPEHFLG